MITLPLYQIDAFAGEVFSGNPAAVVPLDAWLTDSQMQSIAAENNLAETAFFVPNPSGGYDLRWFTPAQEVPLCGHATLAAAFVLFTEIDPSLAAAVFETQSGMLTVTRTENGLLTLDFPSHEMFAADAPPALLSGLRLPPSAVYETRSSPNYLAVYASEAEVRALTPDFSQFTMLDLLGVAVTAPGDDTDFVSRYFAPRLGIPEDPVTGSTHCALAPYWAQRLGRTTLRARQVSQRGGELFCTVADNRVQIAGRAVKYLEGRIFV